jgi:Helix-turn-helix domain
VEHLHSPDASLPFPPPADGYLTTAAAAELAGVSKVAICKWCRRHPGVAIRPGMQWLIRPEPFAAFLRRRAGGGRAQG